LSKIIIEHKSSIFGDELIIDDRKKRRFSIGGHEGKFEISVDKTPIYEGSRFLNNLRFKGGRVEAKWTNRDTWVFETNSSDTLSLSEPSKRMKAKIQSVMKNGKIIGRFIHSNKWLVCKRKYVLYCVEESAFDECLFVFNFYLNEKSRNHSVSSG
jgi:ribosomal protein S8E